MDTNIDLSQKPHYIFNSNIDITQNQLSEIQYGEKYELRTAIELTKKQMRLIEQAYKDPFVSGVINAPVIKKTTLDTFQEQHSMKLTHVLIIAGITFMFLSNYQNGQAPFSYFVTSA